MTWILATFYKFVQLTDVASLRDPLLQQCQAVDLRGTILLAEEGINGTIAGTRGAVEATLAYLRQDPRLADLHHRETQTQIQQPFQRMKVKIKREIVTLGQPHADPSQQVGQYVDPEEWNALLQDPEVTVIDARNHYEVSIGSFQGAVDPQTECFRQFPDYVQEHLDPQQHPKVALFCTGGIRCEKATAYLLNQGFSQVYHLKGGILRYLEQVEPDQSLWQGECFVFDQRVALQHGLEDGTYQLCQACGYPLSPEELNSPEYLEGLQCPYCARSKGSNSKGISQSDL